VASRASRLTADAAAVAVGLGAWGLFESQWLRVRILEVPVVGLPPALDGLSILHLSDFHVGTPSLNMRALQKAVDFGVRAHPDLVAVTGDVVSHPRAERAARTELARLRPPLGMFAVTGNHEVASTNDPFSRPVVIDDWSPADVELLRDRSVTLTHAGAAIEVAGSDAETWLGEGGVPAEKLFTEPGAFRILLAHFPDIALRIPQGTCSLVLSGHLHGGQICIPTLHGKRRLSHNRWVFEEGVIQHGATTVVVSRGTGTTLLPFRFLARPEACLLRLRPV
jgi:predicted MPP superfamily phosphohydrolase